MTALMLAAWKGHASVIVSLLESDTNIEIDHQTEVQWSPTAS